VPEPTGILSMIEAQGFWTSYSRGQFLKTAHLRANTLIPTLYTYAIDFKTQKSVNHVHVANNCLHQARQSGSTRATSLFWQPLKFSKTNCEYSSKTTVNEQKHSFV
jgi:hypothetical protein